MLIWHHSLHPKHGPFLFLDRDGVINRDRDDYVKRKSEYLLYPDALEALAWLSKKDINVILVSNQSGLGRGIIRWDDFYCIRRHMLQQIRWHGGELLAEFYCPHRPEAGCACRKPQPGTLLAAAQMFSIQLARSVLIGDQATDMQAARNAGCTSFLLRREQPTRQPANTCKAGTPDCSENLLQAVAGLFR